MTSKHKRHRKVASNSPICPVTPTLFQDELENFRKQGVCTFASPEAVAVRKKLIQIAIEDTEIWQSILTELQSSKLVTNTAIFAVMQDKEFLERKVICKLEKTDRIVPRSIEKSNIFSFGKDVTFIKSYAAIPQGAEHFRKFVSETFTVCSKRIGKAALAAGQVTSNIRLIEISESDTPFEGECIKIGKVDQKELLEEFPPNYESRGECKRISARTPNSSASTRAKAA